MTLHCDKCGLAVPITNDATQLEALVQGLSGQEAALALVATTARHLLPMENGGVLVCPGSPSRAQYLDGQPRDERYPYDPSKEKAYRAAFERLKGMSKGEA